MASDRGSGVISSLIGVAVVLCFLLLASHVLLYLSTSSRVHAVAVDAARVVSGAEAGHARAEAVAAAERNARGVLGAHGAQAEFRWESLGPDWVVVRVSMPGPRLLPANLANPTGLSRIERRVRLRVERFR